MKMMPKQGTKKKQKISGVVCVVCLMSIWVESLQPCWLETEEGQKSVLSPKDY